MKYVLSFFGGGTIAILIFFLIVAVIELVKDDTSNIDHTLNQSTEVGNSNEPRQSDIATNNDDIISTDSENKDLKIGKHKPKSSSQSLLTPNSKSKSSPSVNPLTASENESKNVSSENIDDPIKKFTREDAIQDLLDSGMTMEQISKGTITIGGLDPLPGIDPIVRRISDAPRGSRAHWDLLQDMIKVYESSPDPNYRLYARGFKLRDTDGNPITTYEGYKQYVKDQDERMSKIKQK